jgi:hypothetical protein
MRTDRRKQGAAFSIRTVSCFPGPDGGRVNAGDGRRGVEHTVMTEAISGRPARCLANRFTALDVGVERKGIPDYAIAYDVGNSLNATAKAAGEIGYGALW